MTILGFLSVEKFLLYLCPIRIAREGDEEVRSTVVSHVGHGIMRMLMHVPGTTGKARRQYNQLAHVGNISIFEYGIPQMRILLHSQRHLVKLNVPQPLKFNLGIHVNDKLLKQASTCLLYTSRCV